MHRLKWDHQPERRSRSWALSIKAQRIELGEVLDDNPGLKPRIAEAGLRGYERATVEAARKTGLDEDKFPSQCAYAWNDITARDFIWSRGYHWRCDPPGCTVFALNS
jgi:hypothetical protein